MNKKLLSITAITTFAVAMAAQADNIKTAKPPTMAIQPKQQIINAKAATSLRQGKPNFFGKQQQTPANPYSFNNKASGVTR